MEKNDVLVYLPMIYPARIGGVEIYNYHLAKNIQSFDNNSNYIFCTTSESMKGHEDNFFVFNERLFIIRKYGLGGISYFLSMLFSRKVELKKIRSVYTSYVSGTSTADIVLLLLLNFFFSIRIVIHVHGGGMKPWSPYWLHKRLFKKSHKILGVSPKICEEYAHRSGRQVELSLPMVPFSKTGKNKEEIKKELGFERFKTIVLFVGSIKDLKAPGTLLDAILSLSDSWVTNNNPAVVFCGDGALRQGLEEKAKTSKYSDRIFFQGNVENKEINKYYEIADKYVICSWFEGTPISLLQAFYNGVLSFGTNVDGINTVITDNKTGFLFKKGDHVGLSSLLQNNYSAKTIIDITHSAKVLFDSQYNYSTIITNIINTLR